ncbi:MAG: hypothetical protein R2762_20470 [Bryobacteraceae bacterium]
MNTDSYFRSIRGPVMLMTLGILMMFDHADSFPIGNTWPVLVVVFGLLVLAERLTQPARPPMGPPPQPPAPFTPGGFES